MPRTADPAVAEALVEAGARLIAGHQPLSTRRLAAEVGVSTSAVYTHFGSMEELRRAIRSVAFDRLAAHLRMPDDSDDPVADLIKRGWSYCRNGLVNPNLYRVMFMERPLDARDAETGLETFQIVVDSVQRCIDAKRFSDDDAFQMAMAIWSGTHGPVALHLAGMIGVDEVIRLFTVGGRALLVAFGDEPARLDASIAAAQDWIALQPPLPEAL